MKAVELLKNGELHLVTRKVGPLKPSECRVKIEVCGICSSDIPRAFENGAYHYPLIMGHEFSGIVEEVGRGCSRIKNGDRVSVFPLKPCFSCRSCSDEHYAQCANYDYYGSRSDGAYAEYLNVSEWNLVHITDDICAEDAALLEPLSVVVHALNKTRVLASSAGHPKVLVIGAGFLGLLAVKILINKNPDMDLVVIDRNRFKLEIAEQMGAAVFNAPDETTWQQFVDKNPNSFDYVIEMTGVPENLPASINLAERHATVLWVGNVSGDVSLSKSVVSSVLRKELNLVGSWNSIYRPGKRDDWSAALQLIRGGLRPSELVTNWTQLERAPELLQQVANHKARIRQFDHIKCAIKNG